mgnify:CR=1 FL=1
MEMLAIALVLCVIGAYVCCIGMGVQEIKEGNYLSAFLFILGMPGLFGLMIFLIEKGIL